MVDVIKLQERAYRDGYAAALSSLSPLIEAAREMTELPQWARIHRECKDWRPLDAANGKLRRALSTFPAPASPWRPMETAPKDGTLVYLWWPYWRSAPVVGQYLENWNGGHGEQSGWRSEMVNDSRPVGAKGPTCWCPLPAPPSASDRGEQ